MYQPVENYGVVGNRRTTALVGKNGSIDWLCFPHFDSPSVFAAILDENKGGFFSISPVDEQGVSKQLYWPETHVLITRFLREGGVAELIDFMPVGAKSRRDGHNLLIRKGSVLSGERALNAMCQPGFNYARDEHEIMLTEKGVCVHSPKQSLGVATDVPFERKDQGIWAFRTGGRHYVYSKLMCWVALDRALRVASKRSFPADISRWSVNTNVIC